MICPHNREGAFLSSRPETDEPQGLAASREPQLRLWRIRTGQARGREQTSEFVTQGFEPARASQKRFDELWQCFPFSPDGCPLPVDERPRDSVRCDRSQGRRRQPRSALEKAVQPCPHVGRERCRQASSLRDREHGKGHAVLVGDRKRRLQQLTDVRGRRLDAPAADEGTRQIEPGESLRRLPRRQPQSVAVGLGCGRVVGVGELQELSSRQLSPKLVGSRRQLGSRPFEIDFPWKEDLVLLPRQRGDDRSGGGGFQPFHQLQVQLPRRHPPSLEEPCVLELVFLEEQSDTDGGQQQARDHHRRTK